MKNKPNSNPKFSTGTPVKTDPLFELFMDGIKDIYWAENHLVKALPKMAESASSTPLSSAISQHLELTKEHVSRLEEIFELLGEKIQAKKCDAMEGLSKEGEGVIESTEEGTSTRDVGIILASQKVEHYEMAAYAGLARLAKTLGLDEVAGILEQTLAEEEESDKKLSAIAENDINYTVGKQA